MKTRLLLFALLGIFFIQTINAHIDEKKYYFVTKKDTVFCKELSYGTTGQGYLKWLHYTDMEGKKVEIDGKKEVPDVLTFFMDGRTIDKTPLKADKPDGGIRYTERAVDGKLKVYTSSPSYSRSGDPMGIYRFYIKMPSGVYYKINSSDMKNYIKPYLLKCKDFESNYKGDFSTKEEPFMEMIKLYNSLCN